MAVYFLRARLSNNDEKTVFETRSWIARRRQAKQMATIKFDNPAFRLNINTIWTDSSHIQCGQLWPDWIIFILWSYLPSSQTNSRRPEGSLAAKESRISTIDMTNQQVRKKTDQQVMKEISSCWNKSVSANGKLPNNSAKIEQQHHKTDNNNWLVAGELFRIRKPSSQPGWPIILMGQTIRISVIRISVIALNHISFLLSSTKWYLK